MTEIINEKTGEVYKARYGEVLRPDVPFRSKTDLKNYNDDEIYEEGTSLTDPSQALNVKATVEFMFGRQLADAIIRGDVVPVIKGDFDVKGDMTVDEAFATEDPTKAPGFDLADIPFLAEQLKLAEPALQSTTESATVAPASVGDGIEQEKADKGSSQA